MNIELTEREASLIVMWAYQCRNSCGDCGDDCDYTPDCEELEQKAKEAGGVHI